MSVLAPKDYITLIISFLKNDSTFPKDKISEEIYERKIDLFSENLFEHLYHNLLYFYKLHQRNNIGNEIQKYFFTEMVNILDIINKEKPNIFFRNNFATAVLIFIIYSLNNSVIIYPEIMLKMFLGFTDILSNVTNKKIDDELSNIEPKLINTIRKLVEKYYMDSNVCYDIPKENNFQEITSYLKDFEDDLPLYLKGFVDYNTKFNGQKYLIAKLCEYFQKIKQLSDNINEYLYQGYSLYGILSYQKIPKIHFNEFKNIKINRIKNSDAKNILIISIKLLEEKNFNDFLTKLGKEIFEYSEEPSKVLDIFDDTEKYYKNLYNQLIYYFSIYKEQNQFDLCKIFNIDYSRVLWLNFIKLLLLNLSENDIDKDNIKIIFYFIVNLFNPDIDSSSLEFRLDAIPKLFSQTITSTEILDYPEIYKIIDKDYSEYYPNFNKENNFTQTLINKINKKTLDTLQSTINKIPIGNQMEIKNIKEHNLKLPFPLLEDYLSSLKKDINTNVLSKKNLYNFYKLCFPDFEKLTQENFIGNINNIDSPTDLISNNDIKKVLDDENFIDLIKKIMKSPIMKEAYTRIFYYYSKNGDFDIYEEELTKDILKEKFTEADKKNLINNKTILAYYNEFCQKLDDLNYNKLFIIMNLPESIKGFTFRFLKIVINSNGVKLKATSQDIDYSSILLLLKAYLIFLIIHELNHFMKRYLNQNKSYKICKTPEIKEYKEGGELLIKLLFGHILIENSLNIEQAKYILNVENWYKHSVKSFREDFMKIKKNNNKEKCIVFLSSEKKSICDHSKLFG